TPEEVISAIRAQNIAVAGGQLAQPPIASDRAFQPAVTLRGRLDQTTEFEDIVVKRGTEGQIVRLKDVARIEIGAANYSTNAWFNSTPYVALLAFQQPGENAIEASEQIKELMKELGEDFPSGVEYRLTYNPTEFFTEASIKALEHTILEAVLLVVLVVVVFLQSGRATIIPVLAIPVSLLGTFIAMSALGYSINTLTLFGLVLAVGIVVDDAIVVVENVERYLREGLSPKEATRKTMTEVSGALISIALVLSSVFVPSMLLDGISGEFFRQFAVAIAVATLISAFNSLTLSPALAALLLRHETHARKPSLPARLGRYLAQAFNRGFDALSEAYGRLVYSVIAARWVMLPLYGLLVIAAGYMMATTPRGFVPVSDQGYLIITAKMPSAAALERTDKVVQHISDLAHQVDGVAYTHAFTGYDGLTGTTSSSAALVFAQFAPFEERGKTGATSGKIQSELQTLMNTIAGAQVTVIQPPTVRGIGAGGGFALRIQDYDARGSKALAEASEKLITALNSDPNIAYAFTPFSANAPQVFVDVDHARAEQIGVPIDQLSQMIEIYLGSRYVNDVNLLGRTYQVRAQAAPEFRLDAEQLTQLRTRSVAGTMVPLGSVATIETRTAPERVPRYNLFATAEVFGAGAGVSSGEALEIVERIAEEVLPRGFGIEWTDLSYQQKTTEDGTILFLLSIVFVFLVLAAQYESWALPFAVILIVPTVLLSALGGVAWMGMDNNLLTQVALIVLVGLASKNA
ncbi:MAG: efflux RND transporter permease subunit, partial [Pseudomonadota bacterium]